MAYEKMNTSKFITVTSDSRPLGEVLSAWAKARSESCEFINIYYSVSEIGKEYALVQYKVH